MFEGKIHVYVCMYVCFFSTWLIAKLIITLFEYFARIILDIPTYHYSEKNSFERKWYCNVIIKCKYIIRFYYQAFLNFWSHNIIILNFGKIICNIHVYYFIIPKMGYNYLILFQNFNSLINLLYLKTYIKWRLESNLNTLKMTVLIQR